VLQRLDALARFTDEPGRLTRLYLSPAHKAAAGALAGWMRDCGMTVTLDAVGNVVGRHEGLRAGAPALLLGSHIDTVRDAGRFDGALGVVVALRVVETLAAAGRRLPFAIEVVAFGDEEGVRFPSTLGGSRALAGRFDPASLDGRDSDGVALGEALVAFGLDPTAIPALQRQRRDVLAFIEVHVEQGPVLEQNGLALGVVTAINGASRFEVDVKGEAGHAGTVPMTLRRDALAAAAEMVLAVEARARAEDAGRLVATVGRLEPTPGAVNTVAGGVLMTLDLRSPDDRVRRAAIADLTQQMKAIGRRRGVAVRFKRTYDVAATACDAAVIGRLAATVEAGGRRTLLLPSGAGHDAMAMAALCPVGMLFVRCKGGISHHPAESVTAADADAAVATLLALIEAWPV
jgi:allantoate deiminase